MRHLSNQFVQVQVSTMNFMISTAANSPARRIAGMSESSSMKNAGLERPDSWRESELSCFDGGLTIGGRRG